MPKDDRRRLEDFFLLKQELSSLSFSSSFSSSFIGVLLSDRTLPLLKRRLGVALMALVAVVLGLGEGVEIKRLFR